MLNALCVQDLTHVYPNGFKALNSLNLELASGDFYGLLGPNGAGKSTFLGVLSGLVQKQTGSITVFGKNLQETPEALKHLIGLVPQEFNFNPFETVGRIIKTQVGLYGLRMSKMRPYIENLLKDLSLWDKRNQPARALSGGMKRRLMIARALVHRPSLLLLDEPTAGVDLALRKNFWDYLKQLNQSGTTVILTTHYLEEAEWLCKSIGILDQGTLQPSISRDVFLSKLAMQTFILDLANDYPIHHQLSPFHVRQLTDKCIEIDLPSGESLNSLFSVLQREGLMVLGMKPKETRLESVFLAAVAQPS